MKNRIHALAILLVLSAIILPCARGQTILFDQANITVEPGDTIVLQISGNTGTLEILGFSLYLNLSDDARPSPLTVTGAALGAEWTYFGGGPALPQVIPASGNSQDYGNALTPDFNPLPAGTYGLTTLTIKVSDLATPSVVPYVLQSTLSSTFLDGDFNEFTPSPATLTITIVPEPATGTLIGLAVIALTLRRSRNRHFKNS